MDNELPVLPVDKYHPSLIVKFNSCLTETHSSNRFNINPENSFYNFKTCIYCSLNTALLNIDWSELELSLNVDEAVSKFHILLYEILDTEVGFAPKISLNKHYPHWYTKNIINEIHLKNKFRLKYKNTGNRHHLETYKNIRRDIKSKVQVQYNDYLKGIKEEVVNNPNSIWSHVNRSKRKSRIPAKVFYRMCGNQEKLYQCLRVVTETVF